MLTYTVKYHLTPLEAEEEFEEKINQHWCNNRRNLTATQKEILKDYFENYRSNPKFIKEIKVTKEEVEGKTVRHRLFIFTMYELLEKKLGRSRGHIKILSVTNARKTYYRN